MVRKRLILLIVAGLLWPGLAGAVTKDDFLVKTTQDIVNLCTASQEDPLYKESVNFCQGYLLGAYHYYAAAAEGPDGVRLVCFPDPPPSRVEAIIQFIDWVKGHPEFLSEKPVDTEFRFLMEKWPCKR